MVSAKDSQLTDGFHTASMEIVMAVEQVASFESCFEIVSDPRVQGRSYHPLKSVLFLVVSAVISGADGPAEIEDFGKEREDWLEQFVDLPYGVPSHDTIGRILAIIKPAEFQKALLAWISELRKDSSVDGPIVVPIDGKTARSSYTDADKSDALHIVSAWATDHGITLGQISVDSKSNEITAVPQLLEMLELKDTIVTLDAMGCQKAIAKQVIDGGGDYTFAVKDNHPKLAQAIEECFGEAYEAGLVDSGFRSKTIHEKGHGRVETRSYCVALLPESMKDLASAWPGIKSIGQAINMTAVGDKETSEVRYYISSRAAKVGEFSESVRKHWGIESMHWVLDVVFGEDRSRIRTGHATENMSFTRKFVTSLLKQDTSKTSLKGKRKRAGWNTNFLESLLFGS
jgi:predicted transposase YbfD/YdcC